jgi:hypothetical protein
VPPRAGNDHLGHVGTGSLPSRVACPLARRVGHLRRWTPSLSRLARRIEAELREQYDTTTSARAARLVRRTARLEALAEQTMECIGTDGKATRRAATALERAAAGCIAQLDALGARRKEPDPQSGADLMARHNRPANGGTR